MHVPNIKFFYLQLLPDFAFTSHCCNDYVIALFIMQLSHRGPVFTAYAAFVSSMKKYGWFGNFLSFAMTLLHIVCESI